MFREGSERLPSRASLSKTRKASKYQTFANTLQSECSEKKSENLNENARVGALLLWYYQVIYKNKTTLQTFFRNISWIFSGQLFHKTAEWQLHVTNLICLVSQTTIAVVELCMGNCRYLLGEILWLSEYF